MHKVTVSLEGIIVDSASVELGDVEAVQLFMGLKKSVVGDVAPKRRTRRVGTASTADETPDTEPDQEG